MDRDHAHRRPARDDRAVRAAPEAAPVLALDGISKSFPGVQALDGVALRLYPGEVTALVGENGAGKSTLVKILTGIYQPDAGAHHARRRARRLPDRPRRRRRRRHRDPPGDRALRRPVRRREHLPRPRPARPLRPDRLASGCDARPAPCSPASAPRSTRGSRLRDLGIANKHLVAVARALSIDARVVIMDEPTAALSHKEIGELFELVEQLKAEGKAILFISHKFDEIFRIADRYTVFRDGRLVGEGRIAEVTEDALVTMMVGRPIDAIFPKRARRARRRRCCRSPATATRPSSRTSASPCAGARSSASTAWSAPAAAR